ncbi:hypothetical protein IX39_05570 [Chryseobacterium formosense]|uniref:Curlin n=1 Tax=Chryseobacterium formosense TaxID=236814 RepID=A0A085Z6R8_9FLAO|nr:hypothetical protein [Chryseobacterium formosense]KFF00132.1 hypothetical protein IX39_05570 [Chryseobacterium formosense]SFT62242.1 hypothetical protein SAMN05421857_2200 [Chryseobacterium formosense]
MKTVIKLISSVALLAFFFAKSQQIDWNKINSNTIMDVISIQNTTQNNSSVVAQIGNMNNTELNVSSKTNIIVQQLGDQNSIYFNNAFTEKETKAAVTVQGYNNIVDVTGSNSISNGMEINVKGDNKTVFVRNY